MKNTGAIFLILCLTGPFAGIFMNLRYEKKMLKREIKHRIIEGIDRTELVKLTFTEKELETKVRWEHAKEFEFDGQMYDVVEVEIENGVTTYWCWWDNAETSLNKKLNQLLADAMGQNGGPEHSNKTVASFMISPFLISEKPEFQFGYFSYEKVDLPSYLELSSDSHLFITTPPPQFYS